MIKRYTNSRYFTYLQLTGVCTLERAQTNTRTDHVEMTSGGSAAEEGSASDAGHSAPPAPSQRRDTDEDSERHRLINENNTH